MKFFQYPIFIILFTSLLLTSCNAQPGLFSHPTETSTVTPSFTPTVRPSSTFTPTNTSTPTITPTPKPLSWKFDLPYFYTAYLDETSAGNFILVSSDSDGIVLTLVSPKGDILWEKTVASDLDCFVNLIQQTTDEGFIMAGKPRLSDINAQICLIKTDSKGDPTWEIPLGSSSSGKDSSMIGEIQISIQQTQEGAYVVAGKTYPQNTGSSDALLAKIDLDGQVIWEKSFGGYYNDYAYSVEEASDGSFILTGNTWLSSAGQSEAWVIKTDSTGEMLWEKTYGGTNSDYAKYIQQTEDGGFIFTGTTHPLYSYNNKIWLVKLDPDGNTVWEQTYGGEGAPGNGKFVQQTTDGGFIIFGETYSSDAGNTDLWLIKTDEKGNMIWDKTFGDINQNGAMTMSQTLDGGFILLGFNIIRDDDLNINLLFDLIKTDPNGNIEGKSE